MSLCTNQERCDAIYDEDFGTFNNRYILMEKLNVGGMSITYRVKDIYCEYFNDSLELIIKIPLKSLLDKKDISAFVYSEYSFLRELNSNSIVKAYDFGIDSETNIPYIIMEYLDGILFEEVPLFGLSKNDKFSFFTTLVDTVNYIHSQKIIHGDITPSNIMFSNKEEVTIFDFGISQLSDNVKDFSFDYSQSKAYNPKYAAPEVIRGESPSMSSDMFSLALILYEVFTLTLPFDKTSIELENKPILYSNCSNKIPLLLRKWFIETLEINPKKRRQTLPVIYKLLRF